MTRARAKALHDKVNSLLSMLDIDSSLDGMLPQANMLCVIRYIPQGDSTSSQDGKLEQASVPAAVLPGQAPVLPAFVTYAPTLLMDHAGTTDRTTGSRPLEGCQSLGSLSTSTQIPHREPAVLLPGDGRYYRQGQEDAGITGLTPPRLPRVRVSPSLSPFPDRKSVV